MGKTPQWEKDEDMIVRLLYAKHGAANLIKHLPGRSIYAIRCRAKTLGVATRHRRPWTLDDDATLVRHYASNSSSEIGRMINRTPNAVLERARQIGARKYRKKP